MSCPDTDAVQAILGRQYDPTIDLTPHVEAAGIVLDRVVACASRKGITLTTEEQAAIKKYLAAHFYGSSDQFYVSRSTGRASGSFMGRSGLGLDGTLFGQNAKLLDPSGCLTTIDEGGGKVGFVWLGKRPSAQTPVWRRD
jgi:hypothetical protein